MIIVDGKKFYAKSIKAAEKNSLDANGWDSYDGNNYQWYSLFWDEASNLVILKGSNSGSCWGDYSTKYFSSPKAFAREYSGDYYGRTWSSIFNGDEDDKELVDRFVSQILD